MLFHFAGRPQNLSASSLIECKEMLGLRLEFEAHNLVWGKEVKEGPKKNSVGKKLTEAKGNFI